MLCSRGRPSAPMFPAYTTFVYMGLGMNLGLWAFRKTLCHSPALPPPCNKPTQTVVSNAQTVFQTLPFLLPCYIQRRYPQQGQSCHSLGSSCTTEESLWLKKQSFQARTTFPRTTAFPFPRGLTRSQVKHIVLHPSPHQSTHIPPSTLHTLTRPLTHLCTHPPSMFTPTVTRPSNISRAPDAVPGTWGARPEAKISLPALMDLTILEKGNRKERINRSYLQENKCKREVRQICKKEIEQHAGPGGRTV